MKILKILFVSLICFSTFESNASAIKLDKSDLIKEMSNNKIVETYVRNILNITLISAFEDMSKLSAESRVKIDEKVKRTLEYGKSIELFFPAYGSLDINDKKEVLHSLVQQVSEKNLFLTSVNDDCAWGATKEYATCLGITAAGSLCIFLGCVLVSAAIDAFAIFATGGTITVALAGIISAEMVACATFVSPISVTVLTACGVDFVAELYKCD